MPNNPKKLNPWDRRPWPQTGDATANETYAAVGCALSSWERHEAALSFLFAAFVSEGTSRIARRAYNAIRTFEGRAEMLKAASHSFFAAYPDEEMQKRFKDILRNAKEFSARRNDIAHGCVAYFEDNGIEELIHLSSDTFALFPSFSNVKDRDLAVACEVAR
jgi:hypothetical protein